MPGVVAHVDHLVYASPDLDVGVAQIEMLIGVRATPGGTHPGGGTRNALLSLGPDVYLEIVGPDPAQVAPSGGRRFRIDELTAPRLVMWAAKHAQLDRLVTDAAGAGIELGPVKSGSRRRPDGVLLRWRYTNPEAMVAGGVVPFFIDWGSTPHPSSAAAVGPRLVDLRAEHPDPARVAMWLHRLGLDLRVTRADAPALVAVLAGQAGPLELR